jgi:hypothetical protein
MNNEKTQNPGQISSKPEGVPDKFWNDESGSLRTDALVKSYLELEKKLGSGEYKKEELAVLDACAGNEEMSIPANEMVNISANLFNAEETKLMQEMGIDDNQALALEKILARKLEVSKEDEEIGFDDEIEKLTNYFGSNQNFTAVRPQLRTWAEKNLPQEVFSDLCQSASGVIAMYKLMQNSEPQILRSATAPKNNLTEQELRNMMTSPKYWRDHDKEYIKQVEKGFALLFPEK